MDKPSNHDLNYAVSLLLNVRFHLTVSMAQRILIC